MVHVYAVEVFRPVRVEAQKRFVVVGYAVGAGGTVVLVEVGDEVVVFVPAGKDLGVAGGKTAALPVGEAVLVIVVVDKFEIAKVAAVVDDAVLVDYVQTRLVVGAGAKSFEKRKIRIGLLGDIEHPRRGFGTADVVFLYGGIGILAVLAVDVDFEIGVEAL